MHRFPENNFQNNETSVSVLINTIEAFACTETLDETWRVLEEQQAILLSPDTLLVIQMMMSDMFADGKSYNHCTIASTSDQPNTFWTPVKAFRTSRCQ